LVLFFRGPINSAIAIFDSPNKNPTATIIIKGRYNSIIYLRKRIVKTLGKHSGFI
jgi:hypothetical protein